MRFLLPTFLSQASSDLFTIIPKAVHVQFSEEESCWVLRIGQNFVAETLHHIHDRTAQHRVTMQLLDGF